jgi:hypothetical protein
VGFYGDDGERGDDVSTAKVRLVLRASQAGSRLAGVPCAAAAALTGVFATVYALETRAPGGGEVAGTSAPPPTPAAAAVAARRGREPCCASTRSKKPSSSSCASVSPCGATVL